jgi:hypothetical protein
MSLENDDFLSHTGANHEPPLLTYTVHDAILITNILHDEYNCRL